MSRIKAGRVAALTEVLLIGIDHYDADDLPNLKFPASSCEILAQILGDTDGCNIPPNQIRVLGQSASRVSRDQVLNELGNAARRGGPDKTLVIMFAGHGHDFGDEVVLCASDTSVTDRSNTIRASDVSNALKSGEYFGVLLITDCCRGGGFAESHPEFFQSRGETGFRLVLSSSTRGQKAYEFDDIGGTVFSDLIIRVCRGNLVIGERPGEVYFSPLLEAITNGIEEDRERHGRSAYMQTPIFFGSYGSSPLLFVHKNQTFASIDLQRERYSKAFVRRRVQTTVLALVTLIAILAGGYYAYLDSSRFLVREDGFISIYEGHPSLTGFGYPRFLYQTDTPAAALPLLDGVESYALDLESSRQPWNFVEENLLSPHRERWLVRQDSITIARSALIDYLGKASAPAQAGDATQLFATVATTEDVELLKRLFETPRIDVKIGAIEGLMRVAPDIAYDLLLKGPAPIGDRSFVRRLLPAIATYQKGTTEKVLERIYNEAEYHASRGSIFATAHRLGAHLPDEVLWKEWIDPRILYDDSLVSYLEASGRTRDFVLGRAADIQKTLNATDPSLAPTRILFVLSLLDENVLDIQFTDYLSADDEFTASAATIAALRHGQANLSDIPEAILQDEFFLEQYAKIFDFTPEFALYVLTELAPERDGLGTSAHKLSLIAPALDERSVPRLQQMLAYEDPNDISGPFQSFALRELCRLKPDFQAAPFLNHESVELKAEAIACISRISAGSAQIEAVAHLRDGSTVPGREMLIRMQPTAETLDELRNVVAEQSEASVLAAQVLALYGTQQDVEDLLSSQRAVTREVGMSWGIGHRDFPAALDRAKNGQLPLRPEVLYAAESHFEWRSRIDKLLDGPYSKTRLWVVASLLEFSDAPEGAIRYFRNRAASYHETSQ